MNRRLFLGSAGLLLCAPAAVRAESLMKPCAPKQIDPSSSWGPVTHVLKIAPRPLRHITVAINGFVVAELDVMCETLGIAHNGNAPFSIVDENGTVLTTVDCALARNDVLSASMLINE